MKKKILEHPAVSELRVELAAAYKLQGEQADIIRKERTRGDTHEKKCVELQLIISSLKADLASALENIALQKGYLARVTEDDALRDGGTHQSVQHIATEQRQIRNGPPTAFWPQPVGPETFRSESWEKGQMPGALEPLRPYQKPWFER